MSETRTGPLHPLATENSLNRDEKKEICTEQVEIVLLVLKKGLRSYPWSKLRICLWIHIHTDESKRTKQKKKLKKMRFPPKADRQVKDTEPTKKIF